MTLLQSKPPREARPDAATIRYEDDCHGWALQQAAFLRAGRTDALDLENLADEIADVAGREYDKLESALTRVIQHLLKWDHQPERRSRTWVLSIREHRRRVLYQLGDHPGLKGVLDRAVERAYQSGRTEALSETDLPESTIPEKNLYAWDDMMNRPVVWPQDAEATTRELP